MESIYIINQRLLDNYGRGLEDKPKYRVVWSTTEREWCTGVFVKHTEAGIYLGEQLATREVEKYPMFPDYWILEHIQSNLGNPELHARISYEPLWVFADKDGNRLDYDWEVLEKIIYFHQNKTAPPTKAMLDHAEEEKKQKESAEFLDYLKKRDPFPNRMYDSKIVTVPSKYDKH